MKDFVNEALAEKLSSGALGGKEPGWRAVLGTLSPEAKKAAVKIDGTIYAANFSKVDPGMWE